MARRPKHEEPAAEPKEETRNVHEDETQEVSAAIENPEVLKAHLKAAIEENKKLRAAIEAHKLQSRHSAKPHDHVLHKALG